MPKTQKFGQRIGNVYIPIADTVSVGGGPALAQGPIVPPAVAVPAAAAAVPPGFMMCNTKLKEGCYDLRFLPKNFNPLMDFSSQGTLRVENIGTDIRFSGDLYTQPPMIMHSLNLGTNRGARLLLHRAMVAPQAAAAAPGVIPIYARTAYRSYWKGTVAALSGLQPIGSACTFTLTFEEYDYQQPQTGFSGSFPATPTRTLRCVFQAGAAANQYIGTVFDGTTELGTVSINWIAPEFRRATLTIHTLQGAVPPPTSVSAGGGASGSEDFSSVFATAGWNLSFEFAGQVPLPPSLVGVQDPNQCWSEAASATLMESVPGYNPSELDTIWSVHLLAVPAKLGCGRGEMFDIGPGDPNNVPREGARTHSHDGYPAADSPNFGVAEGGLQKDFPRGFLRSASHEVGHTFNQIHQELEGGGDNSIMTTTPSVADVLAASGQQFPDGIQLGFNDRVRRHLIHLPDPAVRPGGMEFFGAAVNAPQADQVIWPAHLKEELMLDKDTLTLGEPLMLSWTLKNTGSTPTLVPSHLDIESLVARVSVTDVDGDVTFLRPARQHSCPHNPLRLLDPDQTLKGSTVVFWGRDGFAFKKPGRFTVEVILLWDIIGVHIGASAETFVWVSHPVDAKENRVAALLLHPEVGRAVACGMVQQNTIARQRIAEAQQAHPQHPALSTMQAQGLLK
jgi:hypothetical protein